MRIVRFLSGAVAADGGTQSYRVLLEGGIEDDIGIDCRIPKAKWERVIFRGAAYPSHAGARVLARDSKEEAEVVAAVSRYLDEHCSFLRREALDECDPSKLTKDDQSDFLAVMFIKAIFDRNKPLRDQRT